MHELIRDITLSILFAWGLGTMMWQGFRLIRRQRAGSLSVVSHVYVTMTLTYVLLNATDNILEYYEVAIYQWAMLSLVEFNNVRAARAGLIEQASFEELGEVDEDDVLASAAELESSEAIAKPEPPPRRPPSGRIR